MLLLIPKELCGIQRGTVTAATAAATARKAQGSQLLLVHLLSHCSRGAFRLQPRGQPCPAHLSLSRCLCCLPCAFPLAFCGAGSSRKLWSRLSSGTKSSTLCTFAGAAGWGGGVAAASAFGKDRGQQEHARQWLPPHRCSQGRSSTRSSHQGHRRRLLSPAQDLARRHCQPSRGCPRLSSAQAGFSVLCAPLGCSALFFCLSLVSSLCSRFSNPVKGGAGHTVLEHVLGNQQLSSYCSWR